MPPTRADLVAFLRGSPFWVVATVHADGGPQAAVVGVAVTDDLELVFDTLDTTRKIGNLRRDPRVALTMWSDAATAQIEGVADEPRGQELERLKAVYLAAFPDGRAREGLPGIAYVRVKPTWIRHSDFATDPPAVTELRQGMWGDPRGTDDPGAPVRALAAVADRSALEPD